MVSATNGVRRSMTYADLGASVAKRQMIFGAPAFDMEGAVEMRAKWYSKAMTDEQLLLAATENNDEVGEGSPRFIANVGDMGRTKGTVRANLAKADLLAEVVPYEEASVEMGVAKLRQIARLGGKLLDGEDASEMVAVIKDRLRGPMLLRGMYPEPLKSQSKDREPGDPTFPFFEHMLVRGEQPKA